jgi:hypothetical protein
MKKLILLFLFLFPVIAFSNNPNIINTTKAPMLADAVFEGLSILGLDSVKVTIVETPHNRNEKNYVTKINTDYFLFIDSDQREGRLLRIIAHELLHIKQYELKKLISDQSGFIVWNNKKYRLENTPYKMRPWEAEALRDEYRLKQKIERALQSYA